MSDNGTIEGKDDSDAETGSNVDNIVAPPPLSETSSIIGAANFPLQGPNDQARRKVIVAPDNGGPNDTGNDTTHKLTDILEEKKKTLMISTNPRA